MKHAFSCPGYQFELEFEDGNPRHYGLQRTRDSVVAEEHWSTELGKWLFGNGLGNKQTPTRFGHV